MSTVRTSRSEQLHAVILDAAEQVFLRDGYHGASMDEITAVAGVSKQTVYKHFGSKERLFTELVTAMTDAAGVAVGHDAADDADAAQTLERLATAQLEAVLTPRILRLRRLVIGEANRFPELGRALHAHGPAHAIASLARRLERWNAAGALAVTDPTASATLFNWLVMGAPLNDAMLLGDDAMLTPAARRAHAQQAVAVFLRAVR